MSLSAVVSESVVEELSALLPSDCTVSCGKGILVGPSSEVFHIVVKRPSRWHLGLTDSRKVTITISVSNSNVGVSLPWVKHKPVTGWSLYDYAEPDCFERFYEEVLRLLK